ncbi:class I adenylate-forming enzyme family protein [Fodinicola feengrottensis]|uniref:Long-chain fatty acid--CoA ligase n=1 Tax=Fodinicola feengrottensis TaxID=435914 RepID=A0ABN2GVZ2_9ACTN|nr:AMP-binding protein [Fodinicola feengrottensis]
MAGHNLARQAERQLEAVGDHDALLFEGSWHTKASMADRAARVAAGLKGRGVSAGDRVVILMANCPEVMISYSALLRAGAVITPLIFLVSVDELAYALESSQAVAVITTPEFLPKVTAAVRPGSCVRFVTVVGDLPPAEPSGLPVVSYAELEASEPGDIVDRADDELAALLFTGGTTGRSKGVPLTHSNLFWCGSAGHESSDVEGATSTLVPLPLAHAYGLLVTCIGMHTTEPSQLVLMRWFDPAGWLDLASTQRVHRSALVPSMIQMLLAQPLESADLSALMTVSSGAAPLPAAVREQFEARVPSVQVQEGYGCTESASIISTNPYGRRKPGSVGLPVPGCQVSIRDDEGKELPVGQDGEICARSPGIMTGYWLSPEATATAIVDGWLHTGDIGHLDSDGYVYIVDRKKDLIIRGGFNVYPRDIEDVLVTHPAVAMAAAVGRPDERLGEEVVAFVSLRADATATEEELIQHTRERMAASKYPRQVHIVDQVPLTSVGKLDRKKLRQLVRES